MAVLPGLCQTWLETPKTDFLTLWLNLYMTGDDDSTILSMFFFFFFFFFFLFSSLFHVMIYYTCQFSIFIISSLILSFILLKAFYYLLYKNSAEVDIAPAFGEITTACNVGQAKKGHGACLKSGQLVYARK